MRERISDLEVYKRLIGHAADLEAMADRAWSVASSTALRAEAERTRMLASAVFTAGGLESAARMAT
jgi:hypothetical protein